MNQGPIRDLSGMRDGRLPPTNDIIVSAASTRVYDAGREKNRGAQAE